MSLDASKMAAEHLEFCGKVREAHGDALSAVASGLLPFAFSMLRLQSTMPADLQANEGTHSLINVLFSMHAQALAVGRGVPLNTAEDNDVFAAVFDLVVAQASSMLVRGGSHVH